MKKESKKNRCVKIHVTVLEKMGFFFFYDALRFQVPADAVHDRATAFLFLSFYFSRSTVAFLIELVLTT